MKPALYTCVTCRYSEDQREHNGRSGGELLAAHIEAEAAGLAWRDRITLKTTRCFMNCTRHCNIHLRAPDKIGYVIGQLPPTRAAAAAVLRFLELYLTSADGRVAKTDRPQAIRDGFMVRIPPWESGADEGGGQ